MQIPKFAAVKSKKIVITGGPGTGKTSVIERLEDQGHFCLHEVSREIIKKARSKGIDQLFLTDPVLFSELLLEGRIQQYKEAESMVVDRVFIDRGVPDVIAYLDFFHTDYPPAFDQICDKYRYDQVFILPPWKKIYTGDNERYESYEQAVGLHDQLNKSYTEMGYHPVDVPEGTVNQRISFILEHIGKT